MNWRINYYPSDQEAREIRHESFFDNLVYSTVCFVIDAESGAVEEHVATTSKTEPRRKVNLVLWTSKNISTYKASPKIPVKGIRPQTTPKITPTIWRLQ